MKRSRDEDKVIAVAGVRVDARLKQAESEDRLTGEAVVEEKDRIRRHENPAQAAGKE